MGVVEDEGLAGVFSGGDGVGEGGEETLGDGRGGYEAG